MFRKQLIACAALFLAATILPSPGLTASGADAASAKAFLARVYAHRQAGGDAGIYDPPMLALMKQDKRLSGGDIGALDFDPFCQCQDDDGMKVEITSVQVIKPGAATAEVTLRFAAPGEPRLVQRVEFSLVMVKGAWRVHDIKAKKMPSLRGLFMRSNARVRR